jgi:mRNA interferase RelE/StbE
MADAGPYRVEFSKKAADTLRRLDKTNANRIIGKIERLANTMSEFRHVRLTGEWRDYFKLRVGDYRVIYKIDHAGRLVIVAVIGHRSTVYGE